MAAKKKAVSAKRGRQTEAERRAHEQVAAVILLAAAILFICILLIEGESLWGWLHTFFFGLLGWCAYLVPVLMVYIAVLLAREKAAASLSTKLWQCGLLILSISSTVHIFHADPGANYFASLGSAYTDGTHVQGGGFCGALLGDVMERLFTDVGAKIIIILLLFVFFMLVTGTTILSLFKVVSHPAQKAKESLNEAATVMQERAAARAEKAEKPEKAGKAVPHIDVDLGDGYADEATAAPEKRSRRHKEFGTAVTVDADASAQAASAVSSTHPAAAENESTKQVPGADDSIRAELADAAENVAAAPSYRYPPISLLNDLPPQNTEASRQEQKQTADLLVKTLGDFGVSAKVVSVSHGPSVTRYELEPSVGVKLSRITGLSDDLALRLATTGVRIEPVPDKAAVGIEVPNHNRTTVGLREMVDTPEFSMAKSKLTVALGRDLAGKVVLTDLAKMPHLLIAGTTGSGKSVCTNIMIQSVLFRASPEEVRLLLIDPKMVEFGVYNGVPHLLVPVVTDPRKAAGALGWAVTEMLARYKAFAENNVRNLTEYNALAAKSDTLQPKPQILIVIDELADLMMAAANEVEDAIVRLAQMARAAGMHLVIATQRPSVDVITGLIKANIPSRLALTVASGVDSRTILDSVGAEKLLGRGDMLFMPLGLSKPMRVQGGYIDSSEIEAVVNFLKGDEEAQPVYDDKIIKEIDQLASATGKNGSRAASEDEDDGEEGSDEMLPQAIEVVIDAGMASTSLLQRKLRLGYARAGRIVDEMERRGIVGPHEGSKPRQVLITRQQWLEMNATRDIEEE